jgi:hypothetical protein
LDTRLALSAPQDSEDVLELHADLTDDLLTLTYVGTSLVTRETLPCSADRESFVVEKASDLTNDQDVLTLIVTSVAAPLYGFELRELLLPISQDVWLDATQFADLADREVALSRDRRQVVVIPGFQHMLPLVP